MPVPLVVKRARKAKGEMSGSVLSAVGVILLPFCTQKSDERGVPDHRLPRQCAKQADEQLSQGSRVDMGFICFIANYRHRLLYGPAFGLPALMRTAQRTPHGAACPDKVVYLFNVARKATRQFFNL
jgi:hypothetical protein